jgi:glycosyltransferase involved in cell wall biosynthesis
MTGQRPNWQYGDMASAKPKITIFTFSYPPAYLSGGPARSVYALVESLASEFSFSVITSAFDGSSIQPMQSVESGRWSAFGHATIWYESRHRMSVRTIAKLLSKTDPQIIYLNSLFSYRFTILPMIIARIRSRKAAVVLAPRGELSSGALALKRPKKRIYIVLFRLLKLHKAITWHASTCSEKADIEREFGSVVRSHIAVNLRTDIFSDQGEHRRSQRTSSEACGRSLVFFSRITPKKNVLAAIRAVSLTENSAHLSIAGPIEDTKYWHRCVELINDTTDPKLISYVGVIPAEEAVAFLGGFDLFILPTLGENFGHVVLESLAAGTPVIVGYDTPWQEIETSGAGWLCDPANPQEIAKLIDNFLSLDTVARDRMRRAARNLARAMLNDPSAVDANRSMFHSLIFV